MACHEAVHFVQMEQITGFWRVVNVVAGDVFSPNSVMESWFLEGLATHLEARLGRRAGRPESPIWQGMFESIVDAEEGDLNAGLLSSQSHAAPFGGADPVGQHFVDFLARKYGEEKLWGLVELQGRLVLSPIALSLRFKAVYGSTTGGLFDEFRDELKAKLPRRTRPADQRVLVERAGHLARLASAPDGTTAVISTDCDCGLRLLLREGDGRVRAERRLVKLLPPRAWIQSGPAVVSGLSFSSDSRWLYLVAMDTTSEGADEGRLWRLDARTGDSPGRGRECTAWAEASAQTGRPTRMSRSKGTPPMSTRFQSLQRTAHSTHPVHRRGVDLRRPRTRAMESWCSLVEGSRGSIPSRSIRAVSCGGSTLGRRVQRTRRGGSMSGPSSSFERTKDARRFIASML